MTTKGNIAADFDSLTELLDNLSKGLDLDPIRPNTTTPTKPTPVTTPVKLPPPMALPKVELTDDLVFAPKASISSVSSPMPTTMRSPQPKKDDLEELEDIRLQEEHNKVREKMRHVEEQKKALEIKKREELKKLEEDLGIELDLDVPVTPPKSQLPPKLTGQPSQTQSASTKSPAKGTLLLDKFLEEDLLASIAPQPQSTVETVPVSTTRLPSTYSSGTARSKATNDYSTIPSDIPDYDDFMQSSISNLHEPKKEQPITNSRTKITTNTSIEGNNTFRNFMASGSNMAPIKATKPGTMKTSNIPDYSTFLASQEQPIPQDDNKRASSKFSTPVVATAKGVSTRNLEELSKMYQENKNAQYSTLTRQSLVPLAGEKEPHPETLSRIDSMASMKSQASSVFSEETVESDDSMSVTSVSRQESLQDVLDSLTTMDQIQESKDDKFLENFQEFAQNYGAETSLEKIPAKPGRRSPNPASLDPFGTNRDRRRSATLANAAESQFHTISSRGTPKMRVLAADLGTAMAEELNRKGASESRPIPRSGQNTLRLDVDSIVTERQKRDTIRSTQAMLKKEQEEPKLPQLKLALDSSLTRTRSQQNIAMSPSDTMKRSHIARKLHPNLPQILLNVALMDDSTKKIVVTSDFTIQDVIYAFAEKLGLWQTEYFFLAEKLANGSDRWLESSYSVEDIGIGSESVLVFKVKYWKQPKKLIDPTAIHLFYLQLFQNIKTGIYKVPSGLALRLAALVMQIMYGDYEKSKHKIDYFDEPLIQVLVPESARKGVPIEYIEQQIFRLHLSFKGLQKTDAKMKYISEAKRLTTYGVTLYDVVEDGIERRLGIAEDGLLISIKNNRDAFDFYPFNEIDDWALTTHGFDVKINNPDKKPYFSFATENSEQICDLISGYYTLLRYQIFGRTSFWPVNVPHYAGALPDHQLYHLPTKRDLFDIFGSRAEVFKSIYLDESAKAGKPTVVGLIKQIDLYITAENASSCIAETLALNGSGMNTDQLEVIATSLAKSFKYQPARPDHLFLEDLSIKTLNASYNILTPESATFIGAIMECPIPLKTLDLTELKLGVKGAKLLVSYLEHCNTLEQLVMPYNELTNKGLLAILGAIKNSRNLHSLNFAWNNFDDKIMPNLLEIFPSKPNIQSLSLAGNKLGDSSIKNLIVALRKIQSKSITHLDLSNLVLTSATKHVIEWLVDNPQVERFYIANCKLADKSALQLAKVMNDSKLTILDIRNCNLGTRSLKAIMGALAANRRLTELHVSGNKISKSVGQLLCDAVDVHRNLTVLTLRNCDLRKSTLILLFKALKKDKNIKILDLALNVDLGSSSSEMTESIEDMLNQNKTLEELNISACKLSSKTIAALIPGLGRNTCLKALRLDANKLGKDVAKIATAIKQPGNSKIEELTLRKCDISTKNLQSFFEALGPNAQLKRILLEKNGIKADKFKDINKMYPLLSLRL